METDNLYLGSVVMEPNAPVIAGTVSTWVFKYTVGRYGIEDSGGIRLAWRMVSDWEFPQFDDPKAFAYTTVSTNGNAQLDITYSRFIRPYTNSLHVRVVRGSLKEGDIVTIKIGDTSGGSPGARAQSHIEKNHEFRIYLDATGSGIFRLAGEPMFIDVQPGYPHRLQAVLPGTVKPGEPFAATIRCLDELGNPSSRFKGKVNLKIAELNSCDYVFPESVDFTNSETGAIRITDCIFNKEGFFHLLAECNEEGLEAVSNPCRCQQDAEKNLYWGDLHGQNADTLGTGTLDEYYTFARDIAAIDVVSWQGNDFEITNATWEKVRNKTIEYNEEGRFIVYLGYEWSGSSPQGGDYNVFFLGDSEQFYPSSNWVSAPNANPDLVTTPVSKLWERFEGRNDVMSIPHVGGRCGNLAYLDTSVCPAVEIHSHHGTFDWFALEAMRRRLKVGFVASSDDHTCRPGLFFPSCGKTPSGGFDVASGYYGIWAESLTKQSVWNALKARHCYASTFDRIYLQTRLKDGFMGDDIVLNSSAQLEITACGAVPLDRILIYNWDKQVADLQLRKADPKRIRVRWRGVIPGGKHKSTSWDGALFLEGGRIRNAEEYAFDREDQGIKTKSSSSISWVSSTSGDYDGVILTIDAEKTATLCFTSQQGNCKVNLNAISDKPIEINLNSNCTVEFCLAPVLPQNEKEWFSLCQANIKWSIEPEESESAWWVKIIQENGNAAWASPIFVRKG